MRSRPEAEARSGGDCHSTAVLGKAAATTAGRFFVCLSVSPSRGARELHRLVRGGSGQTVARLRGGWSWAGNPSNARNSLWRSGSATTSGRCRFCGWTSMTSRPDKRSGIGRTKRHWPVERFDVACARHCFGWLAWWPKRVAGRARCEPRPARLPPIVVLESARRLNRPHWVTDDVRQISSGGLGNRRAPRGASSARRCRNGRAIAVHICVNQVRAGVLCLPRATGKPIEKGLARPLLLGNNERESLRSNS